MEHNNECDCDDCKGNRLLRLRARDAELSQAGTNANAWLKRVGHKDMSRGIPMRFGRKLPHPTSDKPVRLSPPVPIILKTRDERDTTPAYRARGNARIARNVPSKPLSRGERIPAPHDPVTYTVARNGAVIGGSLARYEDKSLREIVTEVYRK